MTCDTNLILNLIDRGGVHQTETELRYQLRRRDHPLADHPGIYQLLVDLERSGLIDTELIARLTEKGRERLSQLDGTDSCRTVSQGRQEGEQGA